MKTRWQYALLFGIPGLLVAIVGAFSAGAAAAGVAWLYLFGDDAWPATVEPVLLLLFAGVFVAIWGSVVTWGYRVGLAREPAAVLSRRHLLYSVGATAAALLLIVAHQYQVGTLGPPSDSTLCMDYCSELGYAASGLTPRDSGARICSCYDGRDVAVRVSLENLEKAAD